MQKIFEINADFKPLPTVHWALRLSHSPLKLILHRSSSAFIIKTRNTCLMGSPHKPTRMEINLCVKAGVTRGM